jgi:hypothetical protein
MVLCTSIENSLRNRKMPQPTWDYILKTQQEDFLSRLRQCQQPCHGDLSDCLASGSNYWGQESFNPFELANIYFQNEGEADVDEFCRELTWKFKDADYNLIDFIDTFINNKIGKIGEEAVKFYLSGLISSVDYRIYNQGEGDGGIDFILSNNQKIAIQVKTAAPLRISCHELEYKSISPYIPWEIEIIIDAIESASWQVDIKGISNCSITIFVLLMNEVIGNELKGEPYQCLIAGFLPKDMLTPQKKYKIEDLFYSGGIRAYLQYLKT